MPVRLALLWIALPVLAQTAQDEDYHVYTDAPRLILTKQRLRLLQRERERQSMRWQQFDALVSGGAPMPEPGFAWALYYQVAKNDAAGRKAVDWALGPAKDLSQLALIFDWCGPVMTKAQSDQLAGKIGALVDANPGGDAVHQRDRAFAAIALADHLTDHGEKILADIVNQWWRGDIVKKIEAGQPAIPREQVYAFYELMHAIRDNLKIDMREAALTYFHSLPIDHLCGHYPAPFQAPENDFRIPVFVHEGEPDLTQAAMFRAAEMSMVAYDDNALESQFLQGWLMQDRFMMRGALGAVYEFLWANPYQPGLSYFHVPLVFHDASTGHVFARSSWDEDATWIGYFDGHLQLFKDGQAQTLRAGASTKPVHIGDALLLSAENRDAWRFRANAEAVFVLNLAARSHYDVEIDDEELEDVETDTGGTLVLSFPEGADSGVRVRRRVQ